MKVFFRNGQTSIILRVRIPDITSVIGGGKTGLTFNSSGLIIATLADIEPTATAYTQAAGNIETITTLGTFAAPTAGKCRFKEVDATNFPGLYEIQIANARWAVSDARSLIVSLPPVSGLGIGPVWSEVQLTAVDPQDAFAFGLSRLDAAISSRMASFTLPTNFSSFDIDSSGRVTVGDIIAAALGRFFTRDSGEDYADAVDGSVVKEIAANAATSPATIADAVWNALGADHGTSGTMGTLQNLLSTIYARILGLGSNVGFSSPVSPDGKTLYIVQNDDYLLRNTRALYFPLPNGFPLLTPGQTVTLAVAKVDKTTQLIAGTAIDDRNMRFEMPAAKSRLMPLGQSDFSILELTGGTDRSTPYIGSAVVKRARTS